MKMALLKNKNVAYLKVTLSYIGYCLLLCFIVHVDNGRSMIHINKAKTLPIFLESYKVPILSCFFFSLKMLV